MSRRDRIAYCHRLAVMVTETLRRELGEGAVPDFGVAQALTQAVRLEGELAVLMQREEGR